MNDALAKIDSVLGMVTQLSGPLEQLENLNNAAVNGVIATLSTQAASLEEARAAMQNARQEYRESLGK